MAINLLGSGDARLESSLDDTDGSTSLSVAFTVVPSAITGNLRFCGRWGPLTTDQGFLVASIDTNELFFGVHKSGGGFVARSHKTTGLNLANGTTYRVVCRWRASDQAMEIWVNGNQETTSQVDGGSPASQDSAVSFYVGREQSTPVDGEDGDYSEVALWTEYVPDWFCIAYGKGYSPEFYKTANGLHYWPLPNTSHLTDRWGVTNMTNTAGTSSSHAAVIYKHSVHISPRTSNVTIQWTQFGNTFRLLNPANWDGTVTMYLECHGITANAAKPIYARLYNVTTGAEVSNSRVTNTEVTATDKEVRFRSVISFSLAGGENVYRVDFGGE